MARYLPYNLSADSYSFGILLWHIYSLQMPYEDMSRSAHSHLVVYGGLRPSLDRSWPPTICSLMQRCWEEAPYKRPTMTEIVHALKMEIGSDDVGVTPQTRNGSFVLNRDNIAEQLPRQRGLVEKVMKRYPSAKQ